MLCIALLFSTHSGSRLRAWRRICAALFFFYALAHTRLSLPLKTYGLVILVYLGLFRREPMFSLDLLDFLPASFQKSGTNCPSRPVEFAESGNICPAVKLSRQFPLGPIFLSNRKSMFNRNLLPFGTTLANACVGKTPKSTLLDTQNGETKNDF